LPIEIVDLPSKNGWIFPVRYVKLPEGSTAQIFAAYGNIMKSPSFVPTVLRLIVAMGISLQMGSEVFFLGIRMMGISCPPPVMVVLF